MTLRPVLARIARGSQWQSIELLQDEEGTFVSTRVRVSSGDVVEMTEPGGSTSRFVVRGLGVPTVQEGKRLRQLVLNRAAQRESTSSAGDLQRTGVRAEALLAAFADPSRVRTFAELVLNQPNERLSEKQNARNVRRFATVGLVRAGPNGPEVDLQAFGEALQELHQRRESTRGLSSEDDERVSGLFVDGRLTTIPRSSALRTELLRSVADRVLPSGTCSERELNTRLAAITDDYVMLRRYLIDEQFLSRTRDATVYTRQTASSVMPS